MVKSLLASKMPRRRFYGLWPTVSPELTDSDQGWVGLLSQRPLVWKMAFAAGGRVTECTLGAASGLLGRSCVTTKSSTSGPVIVGQDSRNSSDMLAMALSSGLAAAGLEVWYLRLCPTCVLSH